MENAQPNAKPKRFWKKVKWYFQTKENSVNKDSSPGRNSNSLVGSTTIAVLPEDGDGTHDLDDLWGKAYRKVKEDSEMQGYVEAYEKILAGIESPAESSPDHATRQQRMKALIDKRHDEVKDSRWGWMLSGRQLYVGETLDSIVKGVIYAKGAVESIIRGSGEIHASMAWAGICLLLPLVTGPAMQKKDAIELLGTISECVNRYHIAVQTFRAPSSSPSESQETKDFRKEFSIEVVDLYTNIIKAQILLTRQFARSSFLRYMRNVVRFDDWVSLNQKIVAQDAKVTRIMDTMDHTRCLRIEADVRDMMNVQGLLLNILLEQGHILKDQQRQACLQAFCSDADYRDGIQRVRDRVEGTFDWVADIEAFQSWRDSNNSQTLLILAGAGCGKSVLFKHLVNEDLAPSHQRMCCYFFFHEGDELYESDLECLKALLHQMLRHDPQLIDLALTQSSAWGPRIGRQFDELWNLFLACVTRYDGEVVCIIDGIDQCGATRRTKRVTGHQIDQRQRLAEKLATLTPRNTSLDKAKVKLLLSARTGTGDYLKLFQEDDQACINLSAETDLVKRDLLQFISVRTDRLEIKEESKSNLKQDLIRFQVESRTYLLLHLVLEHLTKPFYHGKSIDEIPNLPESYEKAFEELLPPDQYLPDAKIIFNLILAARRSLTVSELSEAYEITKQTDLKNFEPQPAKRFIETLNLFCGSFLIIATVKEEVVDQDFQGNSKLHYQERQTVNFFHQEARQFLLTGIQKQSMSLKHAFLLDDSADVMRRSCFKYLTYCGSKNMESNLRVLSDYDAVLRWLSVYIESHPFMEYAALQWVFHLPFNTTSERLRQEVRHDIERLCDISKPEFRTWFICCWRLWSPYMDMKLFFKLYVTSFVGDHLHPDSKLSKDFDLVEPPDIAPSEKWWFWTTGDHAQMFHNMLEKCVVVHRDEEPRLVARPQYVTTPLPRMSSAASVSMVS